MSPVERQREEKLGSTKEIGEKQQFSIQAGSAAPMHDVAGPLGAAATAFKISCGAVKRRQTEP